MQRRLAFRLGGTALLLFLTFFVLLSADALVRLWGLRHDMDGPLDAALVLGYQSAQAAATLLGTLLVARVLVQAGDEATRAFTLLLGFATLAYAKAFGFAGFPGPLQSWIAANLFAAGFSHGIAVLIFGQPSWAVWLALAALLRVSATVAPISPALILASGANDRRGALRAVAVAGIDVGAFWRRTAAAVIRAGLLRAAVVWPTALVFALMPLLVRHPGADLLGIVVFAVGLAVAITLVRAGIRQCGRARHRRALWMVQASLTGLIGFLLVGVLSMAADAWVGVLSFGIAAVCPLGVLVGVARATRRRRPPRARRAIRCTLIAGGVGVGAAITYVAIGSLVAFVAGPGVTTALLALSAAVATGWLLRAPIAARVSNA